MTSKRKIENSNFYSAAKRLVVAKRCIDDKIILKPTEQLQIVYLNPEKRSWIKLQKIKEPDGLTMSEFEELWKLKPGEKLQIKIADKLISCPRYSRSYHMKLT